MVGTTMRKKYSYIICNNSKQVYMGEIGLLLIMFTIHRKLLACKDSFTDVIPDEINQSTFFNYP